MKYFMTLATVLIILVIFTAGCNIFDPIYSEDESQDYVLMGQEKLWDGDYEGAINDFTKAIEEDSSNADAYWGRAKGNFRETEYTSITLVSEISTYESSGSLLPFLAWSADSVNVLYRAMYNVITDLRVIYNGDAISEDIDKDAVELDFATALSIYGITLIRDINLDGSITAADMDLQVGFDTTGNFYISDTILVVIDSCISCFSSSVNIIDSIIVDVDSSSTGFDMTGFSDVINEFTDALESISDGGGE